MRTPAPVRGSHQCCTSPSANCRRGGVEDLVAGQRGIVQQQRQRVLQLVAEAEGAARLVEGRARTDAAGQALVGQPVIDHRVEGRVRRLDLQRVEEAAPARLGFGQPLVEIAARGGVSTSAAASSAEPRRRAARAASPRRRPATSMSRAIAAQGSRAGFDRCRTAPRRRRRCAASGRCRRAPMNSRRSAVTDCVAPSLPGRRRGRRSRGCRGCAPAARRSAASSEGTIVGADLRAVVAEHPFGIAVDAQPARRPSRCCGSQARDLHRIRRDRRVCVSSSVSGRAVAREAC